MGRTVGVLLLCLVGTADAASHVLLMRHCVRSPYATLQPGHAAPRFDFAANYTDRKMPTMAEWDATAPATCTARGQRLAETFGKSLTLPEPLRVVADNVTRCIDTAQRVAAGLGLDPAAAVTNGKLFDPVKGGVCADISARGKMAAIHAQLRAAQDPTSPLHKAWLAMPQDLVALQALVGLGKAPSMSNLSNRVAPGGYYSGGLYVASEAFVERFVLEAGAGLPVAWGQLDGAAGRAALWQTWMPLHVLYARINHGGLPICTRQGGSVLWDILQNLNESSAGSRVMVGHDTTLDALAGLLGLRWQCGEYPDDATPPMAGLLFRAVSGSVKISAVCSSFDGDQAGQAEFGEVRSSLGNLTDGVPIDVLVAASRRVIDFACVAPGAHGPVR